MFGHVPERVVNVTPVAHVGVGHRQLAACPVVGQRHDRAAARRGQQVAKRVVRERNYRTGWRCDQFRAPPHVCEGLCGVVLGVLDPGFKPVIAVIGLRAIRGGHQVWPAKRFVCRRGVEERLRARVRRGLRHWLAVGVEGGGDQHAVGICQRLASEAVVTTRHREGVGRVDLLVQRDNERRILVRDRQRGRRVVGTF